MHSTHTSYACIHHPRLDMQTVFIYFVIEQTFNNKIEADGVMGNLTQRVSYRKKGLMPECPCNDTEHDLKWCEYGRGK